MLRNALGQVLQEQAVQGQSLELRRAGLPSGLYFVELRDAKGPLALGKVVWQ